MRKEPTHIRLGVPDDLAAGATADNTADYAGGLGIVRIAVIGADVRIKIGASATAVATDTLMLQNSVESFNIRKGERVSAIRNASTDAVVNVTFCTR